MGEIIVLFLEGFCRTLWEVVRGRGFVVGDETLQLNLLEKPTGWKTAAGPHASAVETQRCMSRLPQLEEDA